MTATDGPPVIDVAPLRHGRVGGEVERCIGALHQACLDIGFFVVVGHGIDPELTGVFDAARGFFAAPQQVKERVPRVERYGYVPHRDAALDPGRASDRTEFIDLGLGDEVPLPDLAGFEHAVRTYQRAALGLGMTLLGGLAVALGLDDDFFASRMAHPQCRLRFLHYPPTPADPDGNRPVLAVPHTDYGAITLLATDGVPGLEVRPRGGEWVAVAAPPHGLVVNLGDMLARWTNDRYRSTPHRVLGGPDRDRISIPFFVNPDPDTVVETAPTCVDEEHPLRYPPVTAGAFLAQRIDESDEPYLEPGDGPPRSVTAS